MNEVEKAVEIFNQGGIVIYPTDTALGIGCRIDNVHAIERLFAIRRRPETKATPVLVAGIAMVENYLSPLPSDVKNVMEEHWPGALTVIYSCNREKVPSLVRGNGDTLGVRMPNQKEILEIIAKVGVPILGPSANFSGQPTPYKTDDLDPELMKQVDFVLPGEALLRQASTVLDCSTNPWNIVRQGSVRISV